MIWFAFLLLLPLAAFARVSTPEIVVGDTLPELRGEFLTGRSAVLPQAASGRVTLVLMGFTYESRFPVEAWAKRFREQFAAEPRVSFFEIPMIGGVARLGRWFIDSGMRRGTPKQDHERVIMVYGGTSAWKRRVGFADPNAAYLILLDGSGRVAWLHSGDLNEQGFNTLASAVSRLLEEDGR
jgi:hypothetical protein